MSPHLQQQALCIEAAGQRLHGVRLLPARTAPNAPTLLFLHEGLGSIGQWRDFPAALCRRTGLPGLVYDRWGYGRSAPLTGPRPDDYLEQEARHSLPELLAACAIRTPPILFGHSDGASIALLFAAFWPEQVRAVISEAAHINVEEMCLAGIRHAGHAYAGNGLRAGLQRYHEDNTEGMFYGWHDTWLRPTRRTWSMTAHLPRITCPTLIIQGAEDEYGSRAQVDAIAAGVAGPAEILWLPGCRHVPHQQARDVVLDTAVRFIDGLGINRYP